MQVSVDIEPDILEALEHQAEASGVDLKTRLREALMHAAFDTAPNRTASREQEDNLPVDKKRDKALALLKTWQAEDETEDAAELARRDSQLQQFKTNLDRTRTEEGRGPAYS